MFTVTPDELSLAAVDTPVAGSAEGSDVTYAVAGLDDVDDVVVDADGLPEAGFGIGGQAYLVDPLWLEAT